MKLTKLVATSLSLLISAQIQAESFTVKTQVFCPQFLTSEGKLDYKFYESNRSLKPCKGILVQAWDSDTDADDFCGSAYTDSYGKVNFGASCSDGWGAGKPDVFIKIIPKNVNYNGFTVGTHSFPWYKWVEFGAGIIATVSGIFTGVGVALVGDSAYDWLTGNETYKWLSGEKSGSSGAVLDYGGRNVGDPSTSYISRMAADTFSVSKEAFQRIGPSGYAPMETIYTVNFPNLFSLKPGNPSTIWRTIIMNQEIFSADLPRGRRAISHELGHVLFNRYHSSWAHWAYDAIEYMQYHSACEKKSLKFAWYEGYANFVRNYVSASLMGEPSTGPKDYVDHHSTNNGPVYPGCFHSTDSAVSGKQEFVGLTYEGNVQAMLNNYYFGNLMGPDSSKLRAAQNYWEFGTVSALKTAPSTTALYNYPSFGSAVKFIQDAGSSKHSGNDIYNNIITPYCDTHVSSGRKLYCNSLEFKNSLLKIK